MSTKKIKEYVGDIFTNAKIITDSHEMRESVSSSGSALYALFNHLRTQAPNLQNPDVRAKLSLDESGLVETYSVNADDAIINLKITTFRYGAKVISPVKNFESAVQINRLVASMDRNGLQHVSPIAHHAFKQCADTSVFQTETDEGEWTIYFSDAKNRVLAALCINAVAIA